MVSKNNLLNKQEQDAKRVPHYGLRKLSVGVASVLLSTTLYVGVAAHADTLDTSNASATTEQATSSASTQNSASVVLKVSASSASSSATSASTVSSASASVTSSASSASASSATSASSAAVNSAASAATSSQSTATSATPASSAVVSASSASQATSQSASSATSASVTTPFTVLAATSAASTTPTASNVQGQFTDFTYAGKKTTNDTLPDNPTKKYPSGVTASNLNKTVTRTVNITDPNGKTTTTTQTADLTRTATVDEVTGDVTYSDWSTGSWDKVTVPTVSNYTPSQTEVAAVQVTGDTTDQTVNVTYEATKTTDYATFTWTIHYIDDATGKQLLPDSVVKHDYQRIDTGDEMGNWQYIDGSLTVTGTANTGYHLDSPDFKYDQKIGEGLFDYSSWNVSSLSIDGYLAKFGSVIITDELPKNPANLHGTGHSYAGGEYSFRYVAKTYSTHINYVDESGNTIHSQTVSGKAGETASVTSEVPAGWKLVDGQSVPEQITFTTDGYPDTTVKIEHIHTTVTPDSPKTTNDTLPDNPSKKYPSGVTSSDLNKTITRTINITDPSGKTTTTTQTAHLTRTADIDEVTGAVTYSRWTTDTWKAVSVPSVTGYSPSQSSIATQTVTSDISDKVINVSYTPITIKKTHQSDFTWTIHYVDKDGKKLADDTVIKHTYQRLETTVGTTTTYGDWSYVPNSYQQTGTKVKVALKDDGSPNKQNDVPSQVKGSSDTVDAFIFNVYYPTIDGWYPVDEKTGSTVRSELPIDSEVESSESKDIKVVYENAVVEKSVTLSWNPVVIAEMQGAEGYEITNHNDPNMSASDSRYNFLEEETDWPEVTITGKYDRNTKKFVSIDLPANKMTATISVPENIDNKYLASGSASKTPVKIADWLKQNDWDGYYASLQSTLRQDNVTKVELLNDGSISHQFKTNSNSSVPLLDGDSQLTQIVINRDLTQFLNNQQSSVLSWDEVVYVPYKNITRTIRITLPDGTVKEEKQVATVTLSNDGENYATKEHDGTWSAYTVPVVDGYTASQSTVESQTVSHGMKDVTVDITYVANPQSIKINYVDDDANGKLVQSTSLTGKTDQTVDTNITAPTNYELSDKGSVPTSYTFKADGNSDITVHLKHSLKVEKVTRHLAVNEGFDLLDPFNQQMMAVHQAKSDEGATFVHIISVPGTLTTDLVTKVETFSSDDANGININSRSVGSFDQMYVEKYDEKTNTAGAPETVAEYLKENNLAGYYASTELSSLMKKDQSKLEYTAVDDPNAMSAETMSSLFGIEQADQRLVSYNGYHLTKEWIDRYLSSHGYKIFNEGDDAKLYSVVGVNLIAYKKQDKMISRTINLHEPNGTVRSVLQTATLSRNEYGSPNDPDSVAYGTWSNGNWEAYAVPTIAGYTASQNEVIAATVTSSTSDQVVDITYTANPQTTHVNYVDDSGKLVHQTTVNGKTDQTVTVPNEVPAGWKLVDGQSVPTSITLNASGDNDVTIKLEHQHTTVAADQPKSTTDKLPDNPTKNYPSGVAESDLNKVATRTINITDQHGKTTTTKQAVHLTRNADVDEATGDVLYTHWTTGTWNSFTAPVIAGYTPSQASVAAKAVDRDTQDATVNISYTANPQTTHVNYVDDSGKLVHQTTVNGKTDQTVTVPNEVPAGWHVADGGDKVPASVTFTADGYPDTTVTIQHTHVTVPASDPKATSDKLPDNPTKNYPSGVAKDDLNKTITRTINVTDQHGKVTTTKQTAHLARSADVDEVTGAVTYTAWTTGTWNAFTTPIIAGYTPSEAKVDGQTVTSASKDATVDITYSADPQVTHVNYVDSQGKTIHQTMVNGHTDEEVAVPKEVPAGWQLVAGQNVPEKVTFVANGHPDTMVTIEHAHTTVTPDQPKTTSDKLPNNPTESYPSGVAKDDLNKTVTRTVNITDPTGKTTTTKQPVYLTRSADVDEVTGEVTYGDWTTDAWKAVKVPEIAGYTPTQATVAAQQVTNRTKDSTVNISYTANAQTTHVNYVDESGNTIHQTTVNGHTDEEVVVPNEVPVGWQLVAGQNVPEKVTFAANGYPDTTVKIAHLHTTVTADQPKTIGDKLPDNQSKNYPSGVTQSDLNKTVTRTIKVIDQNGKISTTKQTVHLTRNADVDEVTGEVTYGDWTTGTWEQFTTPTIAGYTATQSQVAEEEVTDKSGDKTVEIAYAANEQVTHINYVDEEGNLVSSQQVTGVTDQTVSVPSEVPAGWQLVAGQNVPEKVTFAANGYPDTTVKITHSHTTVMPDQPKTTSDKLPDNPTKSYPSGVAENDLNKTITRTINVTDQNGKVTTTKQTIHLARSADVDEVTGDVTYGDWTTGTWDSFTVPEITGYTPSQASVASEDVTSDTKDTVVNVSYTADEQQLTVQLVDDQGKVVGTRTITGKTGETVKIELPDYDQTAYELVGNYPQSHLLTANDQTVITIPVKHRPSEVVTNSSSTPVEEPAAATSEVQQVTPVSTETPQSTTPEVPQSTTPATPQSAAPAQKQASLPQTGNDQAKGAMLLGMGSALAAIVGLFGMKKRKKEQ